MQIQSWLSTLCHLNIIHIICLQAWTAELYLDPVGAGGFDKVPSLIMYIGSKKNIFHHISGRFFFPAKAYGTVNI